MEEENIIIMRAFVQLRLVLKLNHQFEKKLAELEAKYDGKFKIVFDALKELMSNHIVPNKRVIGIKPPIE